MAFSRIEGAFATVFPVQIDLSQSVLNRIINNWGQKRPVDAATFHTKAW
jgi:hypothetical protein